MNDTIIRFVKFNLLVIAFSLINMLFAYGFGFALGTTYPKWYWGILGMFSATQAMVFEVGRESKEALNGFQKRTECEPEEKD